MTYFSIFTSPWVILGILLALGTSCTSGYVGGRSHANAKWEAKHAKQLEVQVKALAAKDKENRELARKYQEAQAETKVVYRTIVKEIKNETVGRLCFNDGAVRLWDDALSGAVSEAPARVAEKASGASDTEVLENAVTNFQQYQECRAQLNALIDWHEQQQ